MTAKKRLLRVLVLAGGILLTGLLYAVAVRRLGFGIPCLYKTFFRLDCPTCGITHMFFALGRLDLAAAFAYNPVVLCLLPLWCAVCIRLACLYVQSGRVRLEKWMLATLLFSVLALFFYGILRNFM